MSQSSSRPAQESQPQRAWQMAQVRQRVADNLTAYFYTLPTAPELRLVENRTAWRIVIARTEGDGQLIFAPFSKRTLRSSILDLFDYQRWEKRGFIRVSSYAPPPSLPRFAQAVRITTWGALALAVLALPVLWTSLTYWGGLIILILCTFLVERQPIFRWVGEALNLFVILLIGLGLSYGFYLLIISGQSRTDFTVQMGIGLIFFITLASSVPALLYYLFERQKSDTLREFFLRDVIRLDPNVYTLDDAEFRYGRLSDDVHGRKHAQDFLGGLQVSLLTNLALTTLGWCLALLPNITRVPSDRLTPHQAIPLLIVPLTHPVIYGALGSYFFGLNLLFRRYVRSDLGPKAYTHVTVRQLLTVTLVWVISVPTQLWESIGPGGQGALLALAFLVGIVPETALALLQDYLRNTKILTERVPALREEQPLNKLEGISLYDQARLLEEGIENIENLAHHNLIDLMLRTRLPTSRLVDMMDQAILYLHLVKSSAGPNGEAPNDVLARLRDYGIRTATDLEHARDAARVRGADDLQAFLALLDADDGQPRRLQVVLDTLEDDEWMAYLREWYKTKGTGHALILEEIERLLSNPSQAEPEGESSARA